jgi:hypothetical protein
VEVRGAPVLVHRLHLCTCEGGFTGITPLHSTALSLPLHSHCTPCIPLHSPALPCTPLHSPTLSLPLHSHCTLLAPSLLVHNRCNSCAQFEPH